jgi:hypothetical protein
VASHRHLGFLLKARGPVGHTVRISIRSHVLVTEPFLVIGLIA